MNGVERHNFSEHVQNHTVSDHSSKIRDAQDYMPQ